MKLCFLASGNGGNFKFFYKALNEKIINNIELSVIADRECGSIDFARKNNILSKTINYKRNHNVELLEVLDKINPDITITNWHKIIDKDVVNKYKGKLINLHYSMLPSFSGLIGVEPIVEAYKKNCQYIGATCHYVDEGIDTGKIISQAILKTNIPIEDAINLVFKKGCLILLNSIVRDNNEIVIEKCVNEKLDYSPNLCFDDNLFGNYFWKELSSL